MTNHLARNRLRKLLNLSSNVVKKGIAGPAADEFGGVRRDSIKMHGHGGAAANAVGPQMIDRETKTVCTDGGSSSPDEVGQAGGHQQGCFAGGGISAEIYRGDGRTQRVG